MDRGAVLDQLLSDQPGATNWTCWTVSFQSKCKCCLVRGEKGPHPCESSTVLQTEAWFISSQIKVGWMEKIIPTKQKQKMLIPPSKTQTRGSFSKADSVVLVLFTGFTG